MNISEKIEEFVTGKLSGKELQEFEAKLASDTTVQEEVNFQKEVIDSIQQARKAELKARLSQIPVSAGMSLGKKLLIAGAAISLIGTSTYLLLEKDTYPKETTITKEVKPTIEENALTKAPSTSLNSSEVVTIDNERVEDQISTPLATTSLEKETTSGPITGTIKAPVINEVPASNSTNRNEFENLSLPNVEGLSTDRGTVASSGGGSPKNALDNKGEHLEIKQPEFEIKKATRKLNFHYTYDDEKLVLFGKFDDNYTYLLIDDRGTQQLYLEYKGDFYMISKGVYKPKSLETGKVIDKLMLIKLRDKIRRQ